MVDVEAAGEMVGLVLHDARRPAPEHLAMVRDFLAAVTVEDLDAPRRNPWAPQYPETVRSCLHTILEEEWEHHRYAVRDLEAIEAPDRS